MNKGGRVLITGGAGFIGSHLADDLLQAGYAVRVLDNLSPQIHGAGRVRPAYLSPDAELVTGDVRDGAAVATALEGIDAVVHLAAAVGVGQSMYEIANYVGVNDLGTGTLLEALARRPVERLVVASSMSIYGEGLYRGSAGTVEAGCQRTREQLVAGQWEPVDERGEALEPLPTPEDKPPALASVYALTKYAQERMSLIVGEAYGIPTTALRFFNVFGTRQSLSNPYTGVMAIFASRYLNGKRPLVFEDGRQKRDFVHVRDVARACRLALEAPALDTGVLNIGSGQPVAIYDLAVRMAAVMGIEDLSPEVTQKYRMGDIRHCFADIGLARSTLGYAPRVSMEEGLEQLAGWLEGQIACDQVDMAARELAERGLTV